MRLHDNAVGDVVDRHLVEQFLTAVDVTAKKLGLYREHARDATIERHFATMAAGLAQTRKRLQNLAARLAP